MVDSDQFVQSNRVKGRLATGQWLLLQRETEEPSQENLQRELQICLKFDLTCRTGAYGKMGTLVKSELWALGSILPYPLYRLPWWLSGKESVCQCKRRGFNPWIKKIPWRGNWQPTPVFSPGESHGPEELGGLQSMGREESDTTERLHFHLSRGKQSHDRPYSQESLPRILSSSLH